MKHTENEKRKKESENNKRKKKLNTINVRNKQTVDPEITQE